MEASCLVCLRPLHPCYATSGYCEDHLADLWVRLNIKGSLPSYTRLQDPREPDRHRKGKPISK